MRADESLCSYCGRTGHTAGHCPRRAGYFSAWGVLAVLFAVLLAACSTPIPPSGLGPPPSRAMIPPGDPPSVKKGDDLTVKYIELSQDRAVIAARLRSAQGYIRTLRGK